MKQKIWSVVKLILVAIGIFLFVYVFLSAPALWTKLKYWYITKFEQKPWPASFQVMPVDLKNNLGNILSPSRTATEIAQSEQQQLKNELALPNNYLAIPSLGIKAPINWQISNDNALTSLQTGLVNMLSTGLPGTDGNVFIIGHSSYYWFDPGQYKFVFTNLDSIANNATIYIAYNNQLYTYNVVQTLVVNPSDTYVMDKLPYPAVTLMTCVPVGFNLHRFIVRAKQTYPDVNQVKPQTTSNNPGTNSNLLPSIF
jgi:LPXTG-site transpeptidase (sortase) family protein